MVSKSPSSSASSSTVTTAATATDTVSPMDRLTTASRHAVAVIHKFAAIEPPRDDEEADSDHHPNNPWLHPQQIEQELDVARTELNEAWMDLKQYREHIITNSEHYVDDFDDADKICDVIPEDHGDDDTNNKDGTSLSDEQFRVMYMDMITDAFGEVLQGMMHEADTKNKQIDVDILVDCLQSGIELLDPIEERNQQSYFDSLGYPSSTEPEDPTTEDDNDETDNNSTDSNGMELEGDETVTTQNRTAAVSDEGLTIHQQRQKSFGYLILP